MSGSRGLKLGPGTPPSLTTYVLIMKAAGSKSPASRTPSRETAATTMAISESAHFGEVVSRRAQADPRSFTTPVSRTTKATLGRPTDIRRTVPGFKIFDRSTTLTKTERAEVSFRERDEAAHFFICEGAAKSCSGRFTSLTERECSQENGRPHLPEKI